MNPRLLDLTRTTPLARIETPLPHEHPGFWAKLECLGPGGMKSRAALSMLQGARARGELRPGAPVVESTSGTLGVGLAFAGTALGHPIVLVVDTGLEPHMRTLLRTYGAQLEVVDRPHPTGGWQQARLDRVEQILRDTPGAYWPDQYNNPDNPAGYAELGEEIISQLDQIDVLVCSVGSGGHSAGTIRAVRHHRPHVRLIGVDTPGSTIFGQPARHRVMRGLGSSIHPRNVAYADFDEVHWIGPAEAVWACRTLARDAFVTGGWSTGAVALVAAWASRMNPGAGVVTVFPDGPHRYLDTIFDDEFCRTHGLLEPPVATGPVEVADPRLEATGWTRCRSVTDPVRAVEVPA